MCDSDSEVVETTKNKSKPKPGSAQFRKKPKDKSLKEHVAKKGDENPTASVSGGPVFPSSDVAGGEIHVGEADKQEGTSFVSQVCVGEGVSRSFLTTPPRINPTSSCFASAWIYVVGSDLWNPPKKFRPCVSPLIKSD